jgi:hypothetical protein
LGGLLGGGGDRVFPGKGGSGLHNSRLNLFQGLFNCLFFLLLLAFLFLLLFLLGQRLLL